MAVPAGRGRRQPGPGQPRQQRDLGHARRHLPSPEGQAASRRPTAPCRALLDDLQVQRPARQHADRDGGRVRPHAEALDAGRSPTQAAGRDHWGAVQSVFFAGGGVRGGTVVGSSDKIGGYPAANPQTPENMAATIYHAAGHPRHRRLARRTRPPAPHLPRRADSGTDVRFDIVPMMPRGPRAAGPHPGSQTA